MMYQRFLSLIVLTVFSGILSSQDTFWKHHDFFDGERESAVDMEIHNDTIYLWGRGSCDGETCFHYYILDKEGEPILSRQYPEIDPGWKSTIIDEHFYITGKLIADSLNGFDSYRIFKFDRYNGDLIATNRFTLEDMWDEPPVDPDLYDVYGLTAMEDKLVLYGSLDFWDPIGFQGLLTWVNKDDLSLDTMVILEPRDDTVQAWDADVDKNGLLTVIYDFNTREAPGRLSDWFRTYNKYDIDGHLIEVWDGDIFLEDRFLHIPLCITDNNDAVFAVTQAESNPSIDIIMVNESGDMVWRERLDERPASDERGIADIFQDSDSNILISGFMTSGISKLRGGYICKLHHATGEMLWERVFADWRNPTREFSCLNSIFWNVNALSDGSIIATGSRPFYETLVSPFTVHDDLYIAKLDPEGCLEPECGGTEHHIAGEPYYEELLSSHSLFLYQDKASATDLSKYWPQLVRFVPRSIFLTRISHNNLDPRARTNYEVPYDVLYLTDDINNNEDNEDRRILHTIIDQDTFLLYDFTLEEGDLFVSDYVEHPLRVIESDTMRLTNKDKVRYWILECTENPGQTIRWMEKVGTYHGILWPRNFCNGDYGDKTLTCMYRFERLAHINPDVGGCFVTSVEDNNVSDVSADYIIYPNPTIDRLHVLREDLSMTTTYKIYDVQGQCIAQGPLQDGLLDVSGHRSGIYLLELTDADGRYLHKYVKE